MLSTSAPSNEKEEHPSSRGGQCASEYDNSINHTRIDRRTNRIHKNRKYCFTRWLDYCGCFYFFIKYFESQQQHYRDDIIPIFRSWCEIGTPLQFHADFREHQFGNMFIDAINRIRHSDPQLMARCHLESYPYSDDRSLQAISHQVQQFNDRVRVFRHHVYEAVYTYAATQLFLMRPYDQIDWSEKNYYHYSNIVYYLWLVFWERRGGKYETHLELKQNGNEYHIRIIPSAEPIAMTTNKEDAEKFNKYFCDQTPDLVHWLNRLETARNEVVNRYNTFIQNIMSILSEYRWTWVQSIRGRCEWERHFWRIRGAHL